MPEFNHLDRCMIEAETMLWMVVDMLGFREYSGQFADRINEVQKQVEAIACDMKKYNDQFEE